LEQTDDDPVFIAAGGRPSVDAALECGRSFSNRGSPGQPLLESGRHCAVGSDVDAPIAVDAIGEHLLGESRATLAAFMLGLLLTFLGVRINTRLIRAKVSWWFHDIESDDGVHVHHMVIGVVLMIATGILFFALLPKGLWLQLIALVFGAGVALTLDEFALILRLQDVYWRNEGRLSVDAVIVALTVATLLFLGYRPLIGSPAGADDLSGVVAYVLLTLIIVINAFFAVMCLLKGKMWMGLFALFIPFLGLVGMVRVARPTSPWARWRYRANPRKTAKAERREQRFDATVRAWKTAFFDLIAGKPHLPSIAPPAGHEPVDAGGGESEPEATGDPVSAGQATGESSTDEPKQ
jgi:lysyl-tRNA synthetase class 2